MLFCISSDMTMMTVYSTSVTSRHFPRPTVNIFSFSILIVLFSSAILLLKHHEWCLQLCWAHDQYKVKRYLAANYNSILVFRWEMQILGMWACSHISAPCLLKITILCGKIRLAFFTFRRLSKYDFLSRNLIIKTTIVISNVVFWGC